MTVTPAAYDLEASSLRCLLVDVVRSVRLETLAAGVEASTDVDGRCDQHLLLAFLYRALGWSRTDRLDAALCGYTGARAASVVGPPAAVSPIGDTGELELDERLGWTPLLYLARQLAFERPWRLRRVVVADLHGFAGTYFAGTITIDVSRIPVVDRTFTHELAHALDPTVVSRCGHAGAEWFADELGPILLEQRPDTLAEADALAEKVDQQRPSIDRDDELDAVVEYALTPMDVSNVALLVLAGAVSA